MKICCISASNIKHAIPIANLIAFAPIFAVLIVNQIRNKEDEGNDKLE
jgi:hypothetical protein